MSQRRAGGWDSQSLKPQPAPDQRWAPTCRADRREGAEPGEKLGKARCRPSKLRPGGPVLSCRYKVSVLCPRNKWEKPQAALSKANALNFDYPMQ